jgi:hypothetical protein
MRFLAFVALSISLVSLSQAQMTPEEAQAKLAAAQAARASSATQPSGLTNAQADDLRRQIARLEAENAQLRKQLAAMTAAAPAVTAPTSQSDPSVKPDYTESQWKLAQAVIDYRANIDTEIKRKIAVGGYAQETISKLQNDSRKLQNWEIIFPELDLGKLAVGQFGLPMKLVGFGLEQYSVQMGILEINSPEDMILDNFGHPIWLSGKSTEGLVDGKLFPLKGVYWVSGTKSYTNVAGARSTIFLIEPVDASNLKPAVDYLRAQDMAARKAKKP